MESKQLQELKLTKTVTQRTSTRLLNIVQEECAAMGTDKKKATEVQELLTDAHEAFQAFQDAADVLAVAYEGEALDGDTRGADLDVLVTSHYKRLCEYRAAVKFLISKDKDAAGPAVVNSLSAGEYILETFSGTLTLPKPDFMKFKADS